jgi:lysophospholipase L1-like esterase
MPATGVSGLDLYARHGTEWVFIANGRPQPDWTTVVLAGGQPSELTEYMLYLPLYHQATRVLIGISPTARLAPTVPRGSRPILFYGTSITQGGCASRPGMAYPAMLGRLLDREVINLGFSGAGKMEPDMADLLAELDPAAYVLDCLPNMTAEMVAERVGPFVHRLRAARPHTPILLMEHPINPKSNAGNVALRKVFAALQAEGVRDVHLLSGESLLAGRENATVDGVHPTDLGFYRMAEACRGPVGNLVRGR